MSETNFTIAVMIYNIEKYLPMCIESIISQKGNDIEILLIDDGSTDSSSVICDKYANEDSRIRVIHKKNAGVSDARNVAINNTSGKWLIQVDGDDVLLDGAIDTCRPYINDDSDLLQFDAIEFIDKVSLDAWSPKGEEMIVENDLLKEYHLQLIDRSKISISFPTYNMNPAWSKLWNMKFINQHHLLYNSNVVKGEGTLFTFTASYYMKRAKIIPKPIYGYRINQFSIMHRFSKDILQNQTVQYEAYQEVFKNQKEDNDRLIQSALLKRGLYLIENAIHLGILHPDCYWKKNEQLQWIENLCNLQWVKDSVGFAIESGNKNRLFSEIQNKNIKVIWYMCFLKKIKIRIRNLINKLF